MGGVRPGRLRSRSRSRFRCSGRTCRCRVTSAKTPTQCQTRRRRALASHRRVGMEGPIRSVAAAGRGGRRGHQRALRRGPDAGGHPHPGCGARRGPLQEHPAERPPAPDVRPAQDPGTSTAAAAAAATQAGPGERRRVVWQRGPGPPKRRRPRMVHGPAQWHAAGSARRRQTAQGGLAGREPRAAAHLAAAAPADPERNPRRSGRRLGQQRRGSSTGAAGAVDHSRAAAGPGIRKGAPRYGPPRKTPLQPAAAVQAGTHEHTQTLRINVNALDMFPRACTYIVRAHHALRIACLRVRARVPACSDVH